MQIIQLKWHTVHTKFVCAQVMAATSYSDREMLFYCKVHSDYRDVTNYVLESKKYGSIYLIS